MKKNFSSLYFKGMEYYTYILRSKTTGKYYCGQTNNMSDRILRHNSGRNKYTKHGVPWEFY
jgi:putative endonuclease